MRGSLSVKFIFLTYEVSYFSIPRCFIPAAAKLWNELPSMIVEAVEQQKFKMVRMRFYWVWMNRSLPYVPQFFFNIFVSC